MFSENFEPLDWIQGPGRAQKELFLKTDYVLVRVASRRVRVDVLRGERVLNAYLSE